MSKQIQNVDFVQLTSNTKRGDCQKFIRKNKNSYSFDNTPFLLGEKSIPEKRFLVGMRTFPMPGGGGSGDNKDLGQFPKEMQRIRSL